MASGYSWSSTGTHDYASVERLEENKTPTLDCASSSDRLTTTYGVGLITADEVAMAGGVYGRTNNTFYLYTGQSYWTMTPYHYRYADDFYVTSNGSMSNMSVDNSQGIRPVINLKADTLVTGDGTASRPFVVEN